MTEQIVPHWSGVGEPIRFGAIILVDGGLPQGRHGKVLVLRPFGETELRRTQAYGHRRALMNLWNGVMCSARQDIERAWGMVANRFRRFRAALDLKRPSAAQRGGELIVCALIIHNMCIEAKEPQDIFRNPMHADVEAIVASWRVEHDQANASRIGPPCSVDSARGATKTAAEKSFLDDARLSIATLLHNQGIKYNATTDAVHYPK